MITLELRDKILQYADSGITLSELEDWYVPRIPFFLKSQDSTDSEIIAAVELGISELSEVIRTELALRRYLRKTILDEVIQFQVSDKPLILTISGSSNHTLENQFSNTSFEYSSARV